jgi:tetratricopeptide (TPR) repeat protein
MIVRRFHLVSVALSVVLAAAGTGAAAAPMKFDISGFSQAATQCDKLASHPDDPNKVLPGLERPQMDLPAAVAACRADLEKDPANPRLLYLLARVLTYSGRVDEALPYIEKSAAMKYPQSLFVTGYLYLDGAYKAPKNPCRAGELIRESAVYGRIAGQVGFPKYVMDGRFQGCPVRQDPAEMSDFLQAAKASKPEYYTELLIDVLQKDLAAYQAPAVAK